MVEFNEIVEALEDKNAYPHDTEEIKKITTAVSVVFLTGRFAYKINKAMNLGFLDFSTLEKRKEQCEKELEHNSLITPELYEDKVVITFDENEGIKINGGGKIIEHGIKMKQMNPEATMNYLILKGDVSEEHILELAEKIYEFHKIAPMNEEISSFGSIEKIKFNWDENFQQTEKYKELISNEDLNKMKSKINNFIVENKNIFSKRVKKGKIKHCHGDFHSGNVFITDKIRIFDSIVFNKRFPCSDVIAEIAFMAMDLEFYGKEKFSNLFVEKYKELSKDEDIDKLLNFYKCYRAYIRAKINCFTSDNENLSLDEVKDVKELATKYFKLAKNYSILLNK